MPTFDVIVIGSGPGGYVAAIRAAQLGMKTLCADMRKAPGGTCLNVGCIPSKTLLHDSEQIGANFKKMMERKEGVVKGFQQGVLQLFQKNKVTFAPGPAKILSPNQVQIAGEPYTATKGIILATGSEPIPLPFLPFDERRIVSSTGALSLDRVPQKLLIVGAGVIGVEIGSVYSRLGSQVTFVEFMDRICPTFDKALSQELLSSLTKQGMTFHLSTKVTGAEISAQEIILRTGDKELRGDTVLVAIGRRPYTQNLGLETVGIATPITVDGQFRTSVPSIYAIGDLIDGPMLAHKASEEGIAVAEIMAGQAPTVDYMSIPNVVYTHPEVASVGFTEEELKNIPYSKGQFPFKINSRAQCTGETEGFVKILADPITDRLLGVHIIGAHASELIAAASIALRHRLTAKDLAHTPFAHPTLSEAIKEAALDLHRLAIHK